MLRSFLFVVLIACGGKQAPAPSPSPSPSSSPAPTGGSAATMTSDQCTGAGGEVVGDIGDGAIHRPEYRCPKSGEPPIGHIGPAAPGAPQAIEGAVCCR